VSIIYRLSAFISQDYEVIRPFRFRFCDSNTNRLTLTIDIMSGDLYLLTSCTDYVLARYMRTA
jgi:hypothetical protein